MRHCVYVVEEDICEDGGFYDSYRFSNISCAFLDKEQADKYVEELRNVEKEKKEKKEKCVNCVLSEKMDESYNDDKDDFDIDKLLSIINSCEKPQCFEWSDIFTKHKSKTEAMRNIEKYIKTDDDCDLDCFIYDVDICENYYKNVIANEYSRRYKIHEVRLKGSD